MDKYELLGFLLQQLRDDHGAEEGDIGPDLLRETTKIYGLIIQHGCLSRDMFDLSGIVNKRTNAVPKGYRSYQTTNYPVNFVCFADDFADWLKGNRAEDSLGVVELIEMTREWSLVDITITPQLGGSMVVARSLKGVEFPINEQVFIENDN